MNAPLSVAVVAAGLVLQVTLARYTAGGTWVFDLVLVSVVFVALQAGPGAGILVGTVGGLLQDFVSGGVAGVGGLSKTIVGCLSGIVGAQFVMTRPYGRAVVVAIATPIHRLLVEGLVSVIDQRWLGVSLGAMLAEMVLNTTAALVLFYGLAAWPGVLARRRASRRSGLSRRQW